MGTQMKMEVPMDMVVAHMVIVDQMEMETAQSMETLRGKDTPKEGEEVQMVAENPMGMGVTQIEEKDLPEEMGIQMEEMEVLTLLPRRRGHRRPKYVYVLQGPPGPPGQEGQPGQAGKDGRDGQALPLTRALEEALRAQRTNIDTTGLENSFSQFGRTMSEVLKAQQRTNQNLEEQFKRANETQEFQTEAMQDMAQAKFQMKFGHMFAGVPAKSEILLFLTLCI